MHREFVSRVAGQVCAPELEAQIASDMNAVRNNVFSSYPFRNIQGAQRTLERTRVVASDQKLRLDFLYSVNPDCTSMGFATASTFFFTSSFSLTLAYELVRAISVWT